MALSTSDRQARYRNRIARGELRRIQFSLPLEVASKMDYLCEALQCNKMELFARMIPEEYARQGEPGSYSLTTS